MNKNSIKFCLLAGRNKIISCEFKTTRDGIKQLHAKFDNGKECIVIEFFVEEVTLKEESFLGLTIREAQALHVHECTHAAILEEEKCFK